MTLLEHIAVLSFLVATLGLIRLLVIDLITLIKWFRKQKNKHKLKSKVKHKRKKRLSSGGKNRR